MGYSDIFTKSLEGEKKKGLQVTKHTYFIVLSEIHPHNISQGEASLEEKQSSLKPFKLV